MAALRNVRFANGPDSRIDPGLIPAIAEDGSLYPVDKMEAHRRGLYHQAVSVFIFSGELLLIQRRASGKYHCGGLWANSCCSHPYWNETEEAAASRRLVEELGLEARLTAGNIVSYRAPVTRGLVENERVHVFHGRVDHRSCRIAPNSDEVSETRWASRPELLSEAQSAPDGFAPWFLIYLERWDELGI
jgi:isopentenyl-diphosphate delta-isomerase